MKNERFNQVVALAVGAAMVLIAQALGVSNVSMAVYQAYGELASLLVAGLIGLILFAAPIVLLTMYGKKQEETASPKVPTPSPAIRANPPAPIPEYPHAPPVATSNPDDLVQQMSESAPYPPDQSQSSVLSCSECGHENPAEVNFCTKCRAKMTLQCSKCGFKSPQGSEFCGSCGAETEVGAAIRIRKEAKAAAAATPKTIVQKVRHGIAVIFYIFAAFLALAYLAGGEPGEPWLSLSNLGVAVFIMLFVAGLGYWIDPSSYTDHYPHRLRKIFSKRG